jgi:hypothetical protein
LGDCPSDVDAALALGCVDRILPKPKLPRSLRKKPRYFRLDDVDAIEKAANSVTLTAIKEKGLPNLVSEALAA